MKPTAYSLQPTVTGLRVAFTLVELMVVVAIIAVLLMMLMPNIRAVREKAMTSTCQNNLRQYGIAINQYMSAGGRAAGGAVSGAYNIVTKESENTGGFLKRNASTASDNVGPPRFYNIVNYFPGVTISNLSAGVASVRVCPAVMQQIRTKGNFFDPNSKNFKGEREETTVDGDTYVVADFEAGWTEGDTNSGSDAVGNLVLSVWFSTYAINPNQSGQIKASIPENVVAYIDWNAREGWGAYLGYTTWMFTGTDSQGKAVAQKPPTQKRADGAWWLTEVGFHHSSGKEYGANYVAMDGHVGWVGSNTLMVKSNTIFTTGK